MFVCWSESRACLAKGRHEKHELTDVELAEWLESEKRLAWGDR